MYEKLYEQFYEKEKFTKSLRTVLRCFVSAKGLRKVYEKEKFTNNLRTVYEQFCKQIKSYVFALQTEISQQPLVELASMSERIFSKIGKKL